MILAGSVGADSTQLPELLQLCFTEENISIGQNDLQNHLVQQNYNSFQHLSHESVSAKLALTQRLFLVLYTENIHAFAFS